MENKDVMRNSQIAIRCAKAAILLHALKSSSNSGIEEQEMMMEMSALKMALASERVMRKRTKLCGLMEFVLQVVLLLFLSTFFLVLVFVSD